MVEIIRHTLHSNLETHLQRKTDLCYGIFPGVTIMERCDILANFSEDSNAITRNDLKPEHLRVNRVLST
jgi:hypothetical protein